ncbi:hypothetical protein GOV05_03915 [Candidatus Woesearchaeota archaeon]|nr:hypothetical protein [Candidatus Woesearchaeota archaeon]
MVGEIRITYETLFEMLRKEKQHEELQNLPATFLVDVSDYLEEKKKIVRQGGSEKGLFTESELEKNQIQVSNIKKILKELFDRREKKLIILAMNLSRTDSIGFDEDSVLEVEKDHLLSLKHVLKTYREKVINKVSLGEKVGGETSSKSVEEPKEKEEEIKEEVVVVNDEKKVRFLSAVPKFVGGEGEVYGPFEEGDTTKLPEKIVDVLINKKRAEIIE